MSEQPRPVPHGENVTERALRDLPELLRQRAQAGLDTYGQPLYTHDGRDAWRDAEEEWGDLGTYMVRLRMLDEEKDRELERLRGRLAVADVLMDAVARLVVGSICIESEDGEGLGYRVDGPAWRRMEQVMMDYAEARGEYEEGQ